MKGDNSENTLLFFTKPATPVNRPFSLVPEMANLEKFHCIHKGPDSHPRDVFIFVKKINWSRLYSEVFIIKPCLGCSGIH